jgi:Ca2+-binding EF-hand superfamily protein
MTMTKTLTALTIALGLAATGALAQTVVSDTDGNGTFSIEEMRAAYPNLSDADFAAMDVDGSGQLDHDELQAGREAGLIAP